MSLTLDQKQLVRSVSDIILHNPDSARALFSAHNIQELDVFKHITNVLDFVIATPQIKTLDEHYKFDLEKEINKVSDSEIRTILKSSFKG